MQWPTGVQWCTHIAQVCNGAHTWHRCAMAHRCAMVHRGAMVHIHGRRKRGVECAQVTSCWIFVHARHTLTQDSILYAAYVTDSPRTLPQTVTTHTLAHGGMCVCLSPDAWPTAYTQEDLTNTPTGATNQASKHAHTQTPANAHLQPQLLPTCTCSSLV